MSNIPTGGETRTWWVRIKEIGQLRDVREAIAGILFVLPYLLAFCAFVVYPIGKGFYMSLHDWAPVFASRTEYIGLDNYRRLFGTDLFFTSVKNTLRYSLMFVPGMVITALLLALGVNRDIRGKWTLRLIFFSPGVLTVAVVALVWMQLFAPSYGVINYYLGAIVSQPPNWLNSYLFAMPAVVITAIWAGVGFNFIIFLAARQNIPDRLYEAAKLDGASSWDMLKDITVPQMKPAILFVSITSLVGAFQIFDLIYIMTGGGPGNATTTIVMFLYQRAFQSQEFGYAAAIGYVLFGILLIVSAFNYFVVQKYAARYEGGLDE